MKLSRRETMVGGVLGLMAPRPSPVELAALTKAEIARVRALLDEMIASFNKHTHWYDPIVESRRKASGV